MPETQKPRKRGRYTKEEKEAVIAFLENLDAKEKGNERLVAASKKFGVSYPTILKWLERRLNLNGGDVVGNGRSAYMQKAELHRKMAEICDQVGNVKTQLSSLETEYIKLKKQLKL